MKPHRIPSADARGHTLSSRILIAIDDSAQCSRALRYVGMLLRDAQDVQITLFHVLRPMPRELLEHGGSEDPAEERRLAAELQQDQEDWIRVESEVEHPILANALKLLETTGFSLNRATVKFGHDDDIVQIILDEARDGDYGTIVVSRRHAHAVKRLFGGGVTDRLLREAAGYTLWIVE